MKKTIIFTFFLIVLASAIKVHFDQAPSDDSAEAEAASERLMEFIFSDPDLAAAALAGKDLNDEQNKKLMDFMINDEYFQKQLLAQVGEDPDNQWMNDLSPEAQGKFLTIMTSYSQQDLQKPEVQEKIAEQLLADPEIGPILLKKFGEQGGDEGAQAASSAVKASHQYIAHMLKQ